MSKRSIVSDSSSQKRRRRINAGKFIFRRYKTIRPSTTIVPRTVVHAVSLSTDIGIGFGFSNRNLWVDESSTTSIPGYTEIENLFDLYRIMKVEVSILPNSNVQDYATTSSIGIPYVFTAYDANSGAAPTYDVIQQYGTCRTDIADKVIRRTIYPRIPASGSSNVINAGPSSKDMWVKTSTDIPSYGFLTWFDVTGSTNSRLRVSFKIFYECKNVK